MEGPLVHPAEDLADLREGEQLLGVIAEDVGRDHVEDRLERPTDLVHVVAVLLVGVGIVLAVARDLLEVLAVVLAEPQVVAVLHRREGRGHQQRHEAVLGQLQVVDALRPQQREGVREGREPKAGSQLLGDRRSTHEVAAFEDQDLEPGLGQIGAVDEAVVPATDDDRVVGPVGLRRAGRPGVRRRRLGHGLRGGRAPGCLGRLGRRLGRGLHRHVRPSFELGCRAAAERRSPRPARSGGRP